VSKPVNPYLVLLLSIILPGAGHVAIGEARRGLAFALFVLLFSVPDLYDHHAGSLLHRPACGRLVHLGTIDPGRLSPCTDQCGKRR
jgi:hypothetical protein